MSHTGFFYGTLMAPQVLHRVIWGSADNVPEVQKSKLQIRPAILHNFQRRKVKLADYPAILPSSDESSSVRGTLVSGLTDGDLWRLDIFEGDEYERREVSVRILQQDSRQDVDQEGGMGNIVQKEEENVEGEEVGAEVYVWTASPQRLEPDEWDFTEFVRDKMARWVGTEGAVADEGFQDVDDAVAALRNDPTGGRGANGEITKALQGNGRLVDKVLESAV